MEKDNRVVNLRALAILLVVFGHSIILYSNSWNLYQTVNECYILDYVKRVINYVQIPLFFFIMKAMPRDFSRRQHSSYR